MAPDEIEKCKTELDTLKAEYAEFVYIVSHDLKAPLRAITNLSTWIEDDLIGIGSEDINYNLKLLKNRVNRMEEMMNALFLISRVKTNDLEISDFDLEKMLKEIVALFPNDKKIELTIQCKFPVFLTYKEKLFKVFYYLIENAIKFNDNESKNVIVNATLQNNFYEFSVGDNGIGIETDNFEKIFNLFYTVQAKDKFPNTGAGLTIAKKIIQFAGGKIYVSSTLGLGSVFKFTWPTEIKSFN